jgi:hypothetical protein
VIFYEKEQAEKILKNGLSSFMSYPELSLLAKYFKYLGKNKIQIENSLIEFCKKNVPEFNEILSRRTIDNAVKSSEVYKIRLPIYINITEFEVESIKNSGDYKKQKILFCMLVIAKYFKYNDVNIIKKEPTKYDSNFYTNCSLMNILKIAKINISKKERNTIQYELHQAGYTTAVDDNSFQLHFINEDSPVSIIVTDMDNIVNFYPIFCENCKKRIPQKPKRHCLCDECYKEKRKEVIRNNSRAYWRKTH